MDVESSIAIGIVDKARKCLAGNNEWKPVSRSGTELMPDYTVTDCVHTRA
jgi:hypothetical protein